MSLSLDPLISNVFFTLNLIPYFAAVARAKKTLHSHPCRSLPVVTVIIALYNEPPEDIEITVSSLISQTYPKNRCEILFAVEPDDLPVIRTVNTFTCELREVGISARVVLSDGRLRSKPHALNQAIKSAIGEYCVFYDASDTIDSDQIEKGICLMISENYDVVQARVLRKGNSLLSRFLLLDTIIWYWKYLPITLKFCGAFPLSGEGLFIKRSVLCEVQNFPEVLTEDAFLGMLLAERKKHFALLDSTIVEKAPRNVKAHFRQKLRWHRGYLTCLRSLFSTKLSWRQKTAFLFLFCAPITSALAFLGWSLIILGLVANTLLTQFETDLSLMEKTAYAEVLRYWSLLLAYIGIPFNILATIHASWRIKMLGYTSVAFFLPLYWSFVGFCSICSFFRGTTEWGKTER